MGLIIMDKADLVKIQTLLRFSGLSPAHVRVSSGPSGLVMHLYDTDVRDFIPLLHHDIFSQLRMLSLRNTNLDVVSELPNSLQSLKIANNPLLEVDLSNLSQLKFLEISSCQLPDIDVSSLHQLISLNLNNNALTQISLEGLTTLKALDLRRNRLSSLRINHLVNLEILNINYNQIHYIDLIGLDNLQFFHFKGNGLEEINADRIAPLHDVFVHRPRSPWADDDYYDLLESFFTKCGSKIPDRYLHGRYSM